MHKPRHRARVARVLSYGKSNGAKSRGLKACVIAGGFLLLASLTVLRLRVAIVEHFDSHGAVNSGHDGRGWQHKLWQEGGGGGGDGAERGQRMERKLGSRESDVGKIISSERIPAQDDDDDDEDDRDDVMEDEMDMEDEESEEDFEGFGRADNGGWHHDREDRRLQEEKEKNGLGGSGEDSKSSGAEEEANMKEAFGMGKAHQLGAGTPSSSELKKVANLKADHSTGMFSSDDEPIDEETRERLQHISNIEDALMLKSVKKESWGAIQDEQSSTKENEAIASSDPLNPENNPLLQDPDSVARQGDNDLTKSERALLKTFKRFSLPPHSSFVDQNVHLHASSQEESDVRAHNDLKEEEARNQFLSNREEGGHNDLATEVRDESPSIKTEEQEVLTIEAETSEISQTKGEASLEVSSGAPKKNGEHKRKEGKKIKKLSSKGDMMGWGIYYPSDLTFSNFMEEFLFDERCSLRVFMAWMTPPWSLTVRHQRVMESLLYFHPSACVVVFSDTIELDFFKTFTDEGYRIATVMPVLEELLENTPTDVFATILTEWRQVDFFYLHYTELLRLGALYKYGGIYLDFDMIVLRPLTNLSNTIGSEVLENGDLRPNGAIMVFEKFSPFLNRSMVEFTATYDETFRDWNGAELLDRVMKLPSYGSDDGKLATEDKPHVELPISFFPLHSESITRYFIAPEEDGAIAEERERLDQILSQSFGVHLWNGLTFKLIPEPGSLVDKLMGRYCLHCTDIL